MPPTGGYRTSLAFSTRYGPLGAAVSQGVFSPGQPLEPPDPQPVRLWDFPVGVNTTIAPRASEPFGFAHLRAFSNVELVRLAIETRKDQLEALRWRFNPREGVASSPASQARAESLAQFWRSPDGANGFAPWLRLAVEDLLALDAPAFEKRRDRAGRLIALDVVPGDTIKLLVDETGRTPQPPCPAYQQIIKGRVWAELTTCDLLYAPRNRRPNHLLGFGPVEQIVVTIQTLINRQAAQLAYFTEGKLSAGQALAKTEQWFAGVVKQLAGDPAVRAAVTTLETDANAAVNVAAEWAGTALDGALSTLAEDVSAAVAKYGAAVGASGQLSAAVATAIQAGVAVGVAAVQHGVTSITAATTPPSPAPAASAPAAP